MIKKISDSSQIYYLVPKDEYIGPASHDIIVMVKNIPDSRQIYYLVPKDEYIEPTSQDLIGAISENNYHNALKLIGFMSKEAVLEPDCYGQTALHWVAYSCCENVDLYEALHNKMETFVFSTKSGEQTPLHYAARYGNLKFIAWLKKNKLVDLKALANILDKHKQTPFHYAASLYRNEICSILYDITETTNLVKNLKNGKTLLNHAVITKNKCLVELLLDEKQKAEALLNLVDQNGQTPLHWAAWLGDTNIFETLIVKINKHNLQLVTLLRMQTSKEKYTPLHSAVHSKNHKIVQLLIEGLEEGEELLGKQDIYGQTALHWAAGKGYSDICRTLYGKMNNDQVLKEMKDRKHTALHLAVDSNDLETVKVLLCDKEKSKGLAGILDKWKQTALHHAVCKCSVEFCDMLYKFMNDNEPNSISSQVENGKTVLHFAVHKNRPEVVKILLGNPKIKVELTKIQDKNEKTAFDYAQEGKNEEILNLFN